MAEKTTTLTHTNGVKVRVTSEKADRLVASGLFSKSTSTSGSKSSSK